ncbi:hypothetical protein ABEF93_005707 [Exophiala dermatitidis]|nr:Cytosolic copper metallochaperone [Exophiala dermatitidis]KAJ4552203.1 Cytosolic copper metallochaperone [Exophiala dermatitidis]
MTHTYSYNVAMSCEGCASSIKRTLNGIPGVKSVDTSVKAQSVTVATDGSITLQAISQAIRATGKEVKSEEVTTINEEDNEN